MVKKEIALVDDLVYQLDVLVKSKRFLKHF